MESTMAVGSVPKTSAQVRFTNIHLPPPWSEKNLQTCCEQINAEIGDRGRRYKELLRCLADFTEKKEPTLLAKNLLTLMIHMPKELKSRNEIQDLCAQILLFCHGSSYLLASFCDQLNLHSEHCKQIYCDLYKIMQIALRAKHESLAFQTIRQAFILINHKMPNNVQFHERVGKTIPQFETVLCEKIRLCFLLLKQQLLSETDCSKILTLQNQIVNIQNASQNKLGADFEKEVNKTLGFSYEKFFTRSFINHRQKVGTSSSLSSLETTRFAKRNIYPILSIDGGGIRGIIPATILVEIEKFSREPVANLFNLIGGTSTGGILALGLTKPKLGTDNVPQYSAQDLLELYTEKHQQIFRKNIYYQTDISLQNLTDKMKKRFFNPKYLTPQIFQESFQDAKLSSALTDVVITANDLNAIIGKAGSIATHIISGGISFFSSALGSGQTMILSHDQIPKQIHLFTGQGLKKLSYSLKDLKSPYSFPRRYSSSFWSHREINRYNITHIDKAQYKMADVAKITSAAPSYFPPIQDRNNLYLDGGILENDPAIACVLEAMSRGHKRDSLFMVSLGTGIEDHSVKKTKLENSLASLWFEATQPNSCKDSTLKDLLNGGAAYRFQYHFSNQAPALDDTEEKTINNLLECGKELVEDNIDRIREVCKVLNPDAI